MNTIFFDSLMSDEQRRKHLYNGQIFVFSPCPSALTFCQFARQMIEEAFAPLETTEAQHNLSVEEYVAILAKLKPTFINHPQSKQFIQSILKELRCDLSKTYFDIPHLRTVTSGNSLTSDTTNVSPHPDTWYSVPCQVNWWLPIYDVEPENALAFHPRYWSQPCAEDPLESTQVRLICNVGGIVLFSGAQMHSTVPNTSGRTRFSIDFSTVHINDVAAQAGALNIDTSTELRGFICATNFSPMPEDFYEDKSGEPVFKPTASA